MTSSATWLSPFESSLGYQPHLFLSLEGELSVPSVKRHLRRCHRVWRAIQAALLCTKEENKWWTATKSLILYSPDQQVWLSTRVIAQRFSPLLALLLLTLLLGPALPILNYPKTLQIHNVFHVSQLKPVSSSPFSVCTDLPWISLPGVFGEPA